MKAYHGHAFVGQWTDAREGGLQKTDLPSAATQALLAAVLGAENFNFDTDTIRAIRAQAATKRPVFNPPTAPSMPCVPNPISPIYRFQIKSIILTSAATMYGCPMQATMRYLNPTRPFGVSYCSHKA